MKGVEHYGIAKEFAQLLDGVPYKAHGVLFTRDPLVETYRPMMLWELRRDGEFAPHCLYGSKPANERERGEE